MPQSMTRRSAPRAVVVPRREHRRAHAASRRLASMPRVRDRPVGRVGPVETSGERASRLASARARRPCRLICHRDGTEGASALRR